MTVEYFDLLTELAHARQRVWIIKQRIEELLELKEVDECFELLCQLPHVEKVVWMIEQEIEVLRVWKYANN